MTEMSRIIEQALNTYNWADYRVTTLPSYIATAIAARQAELILDHDDNPVLIALRRRLEDAESRLKELTGVADEFEKENRTLRNDRDVAMRKLEEARAATPHFHHPSTMHMGDCSICGGTADAPQHDIAQWEVRCKFAEGRVKALEAAAESARQLEAEGYKALHYSNEMAEIERLNSKLEHVEKRFEISEANRNDMRRRLTKAKAIIADIKELLP